MWNVKLDEAQAGIKIARKNIINLRYANDITLMAESGEKGGLKLNIQQTKIVASGPITSWQIEREKVEAVTDFIFLSSRITVDGDCSHESKGHLLPERKAMTNIDKMLKSKDLILLTKVRIVKAVVFPVVMYGCESWTIKKAECFCDVFEL